MYTPDLHCGRSRERLSASPEQTSGLWKPLRPGAAVAETETGVEAVAEHPFISVSKGYAVNASIRQASGARYWKGFCTIPLNPWDLSSRMWRKALHHPGDLIEDQIPTQANRGITAGGC